MPQRWLVWVVFVSAFLKLFFVSAVSAAEESAKPPLPKSAPVFVTATRIDTPMDQIGKSTSVVTLDDIEATVDTALPDLLDTLPSVRVRQNGGPGTFSPVHIRGSTPSQVLLLIDGFPVVDAANFGSDATDFYQNLFMDDIERIEVVRGPLSTLYGSDALGGTINLVTKKGTDTPQATVFFEGGSQNTFRETAALRGREGKVDYAFHVIRVDSDGLDSHDVFNSTTLSNRLGIELTDTTSLTSYLRYSNSRVNFDEFGVPPRLEEIDDPSRKQDVDSLFWGTALTHKLSEDWEAQARYSTTFVDLVLDDKIDPADFPLMPGLLRRASSEGITHNVELLQHYYGLENHTLTLGMEYERQETDSTTKRVGIPPGRVSGHVDNKAIFFQDQLALWEKFFLTSGLRVDDYASFGTTVNYTFSLAYLMKEIGTKFKANVGTAFNDPSLTQLFSPVFGNPNLDPEEVIGFDFGLEQKLFNDKVWLSATFFRQDYEELITISRMITPAGLRMLAVNSGKALAQGLELESRIELAKNFWAGVNYTYTDSEMEAVNLRIPEIPDSTVSIFADARFLEKFRFRINIDFVDDSLLAPIRGFPKNEEYTTVDLALIYDVCPHMSVFGRIENLFDEEYRDDTIEAPGFFAFGGATLKI